MYASVISLGAWCQIAEQLKRHDFPRTASPFEWTVSTWSAMMAVIADDGQRLGCDMAVREDAKVICRAYGLLHPHDFPRGHGDGLGASGPTEAELASNRLKYERKMEVFRHACRANEGRIAFVRMGGEAEPAMAWPYLHDRTPLTTERVNALAELLVEYCGHSNFDLFVMRFAGWHPYNETARLHVNARMVVLPHPAAPVDWYGHEHDWAKVYAEAGIVVNETQDASMTRAA